MLAEISSVLLGPGATPLHLHTVPRGALGGSDVPFEQVVERIDPANGGGGLSLERWQELALSLEENDWQAAARQMRAVAPMASDGLREFECTRCLVQELAREPIPRVCEVILARLLAPEPTLNAPPLLTVSAPAFVLYNQLRQRVPATAQTSITSWPRLTSFLNSPEPQTPEALGKLLATSIAHQNSPEVSSTKLGDLLESLRHAVFLPLSAGAVEAASQLAHQEFVLALESTVASGAITVVFAATTSLTSRLIEARRRDD